MPHRRALAPLLIVTACGGPSKKQPAPPPQPPAVATCDDAAAHLATLPLPTDAEGDPVETARSNCASQPWEQAMVDCVVASPSWPDAVTCFPRDPLCVQLDTLLAAGADGKFASLRGEPDDPDDPIEFESTMSLLEWPCTISPESEEYATPADMSCEVLTTTDRAAVESAYGAVASSIATCLPDWSPREDDHGVAFSPPEFGQGVRVWAGSYELSGVIKYYLHVEIEGGYPDE